MGRALQEFNLRIAELKTDLSFLQLAFELRPRIHQVLDFNMRGEALELARKFGATGGVQPTAVLGPLLVRLVASFERYFRFLIRDIVEAWSNNAKTFDELPEGLSGRNLVVSGRVIAASDSPREHINIDLAELVDRLATCRSGSENFKLNASAFMIQVAGVTPDVIESGLKLVRIKDWWDDVAADKELQRHLNCTRTADAEKRAVARLKELSRWRNNWAHGGDDEVSLTLEELRDALEFLLLFSMALDRAVTKQILPAKKLVKR